MTNFGILVIRNSYKYFLKAKFFEYFADPFILNESEDKIILIVERYSRFKKRGDILRIELNFHKSQLIKITKQYLIREKFHLSFPCIYKFDNRTYIVPETASFNKLLIYEIDNDATKIINKRILLDGFYVDPVFFKKENIFYLMWYTGSSNNDGKNICTAIDTFPFNTLININKTFEVSKNRNAGRITFTNYKSSQSSNGNYGKGVEIEYLNNIMGIGDYYNHLTLHDLMNLELLFENSHHMDVLGNTIVFDISYKINFFNSNKNIISGLKNLKNEIKIINI